MAGNSSGALLGCSRILVTLCVLSCGSDGGSEPPPPVATVTLTPSSQTIPPGGTVQLQATPKDADGATLTGRDVAWSSDEEEVATVSPAGLVTGVTPGSATITGSSEGKSGTAAVLVRAAVAGVIVEPGEVSLAPSETVQLNATALDADGNPLPDRQFSWSSSDVDVADVSPAGSVTAVAEGSAVVTASSEEQSGAAVISVLAPVDVAGHWSLHEEVSDPNLGYACENFQDATLDQTGSTFTGVNQQNGTCTLGDQSFDNSGTFEITEGRLSGSKISFTQPGAVPCVYEGTVELPVMSGTVSCEGTVDGTAVNAAGSWCAEQVEAGWQAARVRRSGAGLRRVPTCT